MAQPIRMGIIGAGLAVHQLHWPALQQLRDQFSFVAVADVDPAKATTVAQLVGAPKTFTDYRDLLKLSEVEAVLLSLPIHLTSTVTLDAALAGKHIILEKPLGANLEQARLLKEQLAHLPVKVLVAENFHYRADLLKIQQLIRDGRIGDIILIRLNALAKTDTTDKNSFASTPWRHDPQYRGGQLLDGGVHHATALREIGGEVEWVQAFTKHGSSELHGPTTLSMNLRFRSGALGSYLYSAVCHDDQPTFLALTIYGSTGTIERRDDQLRIIRPNEAAEHIEVDLEDGGYYGEFANFYGAIREGQPIVATVEQAYHDMALILRGLDSAEQSAVLLM